MKRSLYAIAGLLLACYLLAEMLQTRTGWTAPAPKPSLKGWSDPVDPDDDCKIRLDRDVLSIEMPGMEHEFDPARNRFNAPRIVREIDGDFDLRVRIRIDCPRSAQTSMKGHPPYVTAGFLILYPDSPRCHIFCQRWDYGLVQQRVGIDDFFGRRCWLGNPQIESESRKGIGEDGCVLDNSWNYDPMATENGGPIIDRNRYQHNAVFLIDRGSQGWPLQGRTDCVYLRLEREGGGVGFSISPDGEKWSELRGSLWGARPKKIKVGLAAYTTSAEPSKVRFDQIKLTRGKKRRDPWDFVSGWGKPVDPDKDCKIQRDKDSLTIEMPGGDHNYDPIRKCFNAPRLFADLRGRFDLQVRVRIDYRPSAQSTVKGQPSFVSAGFLLIHPEDTKFPAGWNICSRSEYAVSQHGSKPDAYAVAPRLAQPRRKNPAPKGMVADSLVVMKEWLAELQRQGNSFECDPGKPELRTYMWERGWQNWPLPEKAEYAYLRLYHQEGGATFYISPDGEKWTQLTYLHSLLKEGKLALAAYSTSTEPSKVRFDQLKLWRDK